MPSETPSAPRKPKPMNGFVNTWSVEGFVSEGHAAGPDWAGAPMRSGCGQWHRHHEYGCGAAISAAAGANKGCVLVPDAGGNNRRPGTPNESDLDTRLLFTGDASQEVIPPDCHYRLSPRPRRGAVVHESSAHTRQMQPKWHTWTRTRSRTASMSSACWSMATTKKRP